MHPFRFGVVVNTAASGADWIARARRAEAIGYATFLVTDHLGRQLSPLTALMAAATATTTLRVGSYVFANDYRHPLVLAREAATIDFLSGGRLELGLGAGWMTVDYRRLGMPYDPPAKRIDRLAEALPLISRLLSGETVDHEGPAYRLGGAEVHPRPVQRPRPPIMVGGGGPRMLRLAARYADIVAIQPQFSPKGRARLREATDGAMARKVAILREAAGESFERLELNVIVADAGLAGSGRPVGTSLLAAGKSVATHLVGTPFALYGTVGQLSDALERRRDRFGISYYALPSRALDEMAPLVEALAGR